MRDTLQPRWWHSTCAIQIGPTLTEVVMFGGHGGRLLADTTVLQFSEWCWGCRMCVDIKGKEGKCGKGDIGRKEYSAKNKLSF